MNFINIFKFIKSKKNAKQLTPTQTTKSDDLLAKNTTIQTKANTLWGKEKFEKESTKDSNHYYELMGMDINFEKRGKSKNNKSKIQIKNSPNVNSKLKSGKMGCFEKRIQEFNKTQENFQSKDTVVPAHLSNQNQDLKQMSLHLYEQQTGIHKLPKITDTKGNDYYLLDFNLTTN